MTITVNDEVVVTKEVNDSTVCDKCGRLLDRNFKLVKYNDSLTSKKYTHYYQVHTYHGDWGNDSVESCEDYEVCADCLKKMLADELTPYLIDQHCTTGHAEIQATTGCIPADYNFEEELARREEEHRRKMEERAAAYHKEITDMFEPLLIAEAERAARMTEIANEQIRRDTILSSTLSRAQQLARINGKELEFSEKIREFIGDLTDAPDKSTEEAK